MGFLDSIGSTPGQIFKSWKTGLFGDAKAPSFQESRLNPNAQTIYDRQEAYAAASPDQIAMEELSGTKEAADATLADQGMRIGLMRAQQGGPQDPALQDAISRKYARTVTRDLNELQRKTKLGAEQKKGDRMNQVSQIMRNEAEYKTNLNMTKLQVNRNREAARSSVIKSITGTVGAVIGGIFGGAAGASAGNQIGSSVTPSGGQQQKLGGGY